MKKNLLLLLSVIFYSSVNAQTYPFIDDFESYTDFTTLGTQGGYMSDMSVYSTHGFAGSKGLIAAINQFNHSDSTVSALVGPVTLTSEVSFYYRICDASLYPVTATALMSGDKIEIYGGNQQIGAYQLLATINMSNHVASTSFIKKTYALPTIFAGNPGNIKIKVTRGNASSIDCFFDFDSLVVKDAGSVATPPTVTFTTQNEQCFHANDGCVSAIAAGGTGTYTYSWNNGATTNQICNLSPGIYCVTVTDGNLQTVSGCDTVLAGIPITTAANISSVLCYYDCTRQISLTVSGGSGGYTYLWSNSSTTNPATGFCAGTSSVTVTDSHGCSSTFSYILNQPDSLAISADITNNNCYGQCNGAIIPHVSGGTPIYTLTWNSVNSVNLCAGNYSITLTDANNCSLTVSYNVTESPQIIVTFATNNTSSTGGTDGSISYTAFGGKPPYSLEVRSIPGGQLQNENQLSAGCYSATLTDSFNCTMTSPVCITDPTGISVLDNQQLTIYPNPVTDMLMIKTNEAINADVSLTNSIGEIVKRENFIGSEMKLDVRALTQGNYLLQVKTSEGVFRRNISVVK